MKQIKCKPWSFHVVAVGAILLQVSLQAEVTLDGLFGDWVGNGSVIEDAAGDKPVGRIDFRKLGGEVSPRGVTVFIETALPFAIEDSSVRIYIDADGNVDTGLGIGGVGAEFAFDFLSNQGRLYPVGTSLHRREAVAVILPAGNRTQFECAFPLSVFPDLEPGGKVHISITDSTSGDRVPDAGNTFSVPVPSSLFVEPDFESFDKFDASDVRVATWNVLYDGPMKANLEDGFGRLLQATEPDIMNFQEMWIATTDWVRDFMNRWLPLEEGEWHVAKNNDCITASRFPILNQWVVDGNLIVWIDTGSAWNFESVFVNAHTPCCENQAGRKEESDNFMLALRRMIRQQDAFARGREFAVFVTGDLNANTTTPEMITAQNGILTTPGLQSLSFSPDTYGRPLVDAAPRLTHFTRLYTFRNQSSTASTNRIDYILYQESRLRKKRAFVCETLLMSPSVLNRYNLSLNDALVSDHLLVVADFAPREIDLGWSAVDDIESGWFDSIWFGWVNHSFNPYLYSPDHGYFYPFGRPYGLWCWDPLLGWWFTREELYPFIYSQDRAAWIIFNGSQSGERRFADSASLSVFTVPRWGD